MVNAVASLPQLQAPISAPVRPAASTLALQAPAVPAALPAALPATLGRDSLSLPVLSKGDARVPAAPVSLFAQAPVAAAPANKALDVIAAGKINTTQGLTKAKFNVPVKTALEPTIKLVEAVAPEIGKALRKLGEEDFALAADGMHDMFAKHDIYAAWVAVARERGTAKIHFSDMVLDDRFWALRDAEKASILIHEMVHAGETPVLSHFEKLFGTVYNKVKGIEWGDTVEDRAYVYQHKLFDQLGITQKDEVFWTVQTYLEDRKLAKPVAF